MRLASRLLFCGLFGLASPALGQVPSDTAEKNTIIGRDMVIAISHSGKTAFGFSDLVGEWSKVSIEGKSEQPIVPIVGTDVACFVSGTRAYAFGNWSEKFASSFTTNRVWDIDSIAKSKTLLFNASLDGISISPDGSILYGAAAPQGVDHVYGFNLSGTLVFDFGVVPGDPDGTALGFGPLAGKLYANTNSGTVIEINLATHAQTVIATGGSRGDFVKVDPHDGSLLLTQTDSIVRLSNQGSFLPTTVPEPSSLLLGGSGAAILLLRARRRKNGSA